MTFINSFLILYHYFVRCLFIYCFYVLIFLLIPFIKKSDLLLKKITQFPEIILAK